MYPYKLVTIFMMFVCLTLSVFGSEKKIIDRFEYKKRQLAQDTWKPQGESLPVKLTSHKTAQGEQALELRCNFSRQEERCYWDKDVRLDLTKYGRFSLWLCAENPRSIRNGTLYFKSGAGWFSAWLPVEKKGWQKISLWKSDFGIEGSPEGWNKIEKIRLSFWKANDTDTVVAVDDLEAISDDLMVVFGDLTIRKKPQNAKSVKEFCNSMTKRLADLGLGFSVINDTDVEAGALSGCKLAIFPYNPDLSERECKAIEQFVKSGGKIMLFYILPDRLAELIGIENAEWMQVEYPGQFSSISLSPQRNEATEGLPEKIFQGSWNVRIPKPKNSKTKVVGEWIDADGKNTKKPAITINSNGMFMGHVLLAGDELNKKQMLLALFGMIVPQMRQTISEAALRSVGRVAGFDDFDDAGRFVEDNLVKISEDQRIEALKHLSVSKQLLVEAEQASEADRYGKLLDIGRKATKQLQEAFFLSFPSRKNEFRAVWCHSPFGIPGWTWDRSIRTLKESGFNAIVPNMLRAGITHYPSEILPEADELNDRDDQIEQCLKACRKYGLEIHVWKVNWNLSRAPDWFVKKMRREGRLQKDRWGKEVEWLCPSHPENFKMELESMLEIVRNYDVDGIHFDYIRYRNENVCYCSGCKRWFEKNRKVEVENWPKDVLSGPHAENFAQWRREQITRLVKSVSEKAHKINPKIKISAAVFRIPSRCRQTVGQDWKAWIEAGYLDFVCPMDYTDDNDRFKNMIINQSEVVDDQIPLYPGIGASAPGLPPEQVAMQIHIARNLGVGGFIIFNYDLSVAKEVLPALRKGITRE